MTALKIRGRRWTFSWICRGLVAYFPLGCETGNGECVLWLNAKALITYVSLQIKLYIQVMSHGLLLLSQHMWFLNLLLMILRTELLLVGM